MRKDDTRAGFVLMLGAVLFFSLMSLLVKLGGSTMPPSQLVFARVFVTLVLSLAHLRLCRIPLWGVNRRLLIGRGLVGTLALACFYYALTELPLGDATAIQYTNPVWTALVAAVFLGEGVHRRDLVGACLGVVGVVLVSQPTFVFGGTSLPPLGLAAACVASVVSAFAYTAVRALRTTDHPLVIVAWFPLVAIPFVAPVAAMQWKPPTTSEWLVLAGIGVSTQVAQVMMTEGIHRMPAGKATSVGYIQIVVAFAVGLLIFDESPSPWSVVGSVLIIGATLITAQDAWRRRSQSR
jgi:drug/metabolite transporter (DMT)-like permease